MDFDDFQEAFVKEIITFEQFISVLIDNFGFDQTRKILEKNLDLSLKYDKNKNLL